MSQNIRPLRPQLLHQFLSPIEKFMKLSTAGGILLLTCATIAMIWANSSYAESYFSFFHTPIEIRFGDYILSHSLLHWINDGLMVIFFFVVGLEIKRELVLGELSTTKKATLPIFAAVGGMVVPALIYTIFNFGGPGQSGWGIPMATDIAFAIGVLSILGKRVPFALKVFVLAIAIVDDLGAILVIAFFYTDIIVMSMLGIATLLILLILFMNKIHVRSTPLYIFIGFFVWLCFLKSGVHATIAGVILGLITPVRALLPIDKILHHVDNLTDIALDRLQTIHAQSGRDEKEIIHDDKTRKVLKDLRFITVESESPVDRFIHVMHPWVTFVIMPIFALGNAGVKIESFDIFSFFSQPIFIGIALGLLIGKPLGVVFLSWLSIKLNLSSYPKDVTLMQILGASFLAGIGFTMSLFIGNLAIKEPSLEVYYKTGILSGSFLSALIGTLFLNMVLPKKKQK